MKLHAKPGSCSVPICAKLGRNGCYFLPMHLLTPCDAGDETRHTFQLLNKKKGVS